MTTSAAHPGPCVSVIMPVFNARRYVARAVESILSQTWRDFELIVIDDGSKDGSLDAIKPLAESDRRVVLRWRDNRGLVATLNEAIGLARGRYIARMDADDVALPDRLGCQVQYLNEHANTVVVGGGYELIDHKGRSLTTILSPADDAEIQRLLLAGYGAVCHPTAMIRHDALARVGGYDPYFRNAEDLDLWLRLGEIGELANLSRPLIQYRMHAGAQSARRVEQKAYSRTACERAWARRGIKGRFDAQTHWRPGADRQSRHEFLLQYGWWAFNSGHRRTAAIYGVKAVALKPATPASWKLLGCAALKATPCPATSYA